jgi:uncharacterized membrane protein
MLIQLPIPATDGFFNIGDAVIMITALTFEPTVGAIAGGIGSSLADLLGGWYVWVIPTLVIKGVEGFLVGWIFSKSKDQSSQYKILAWIIGGLEMVSGYFIVQVFMYGFSAALVEAPFNFVQMAVSGIVGIPISQALKRRINV